MEETKKMQEKLIKEFTENYMEQMFYFCLKKTGDSEEAQDLTQDIALNILTALNGKIIPTNFSAWVWKIARNRYSAWADKKHKKAESVNGADIADYEISDENADILEKVIHSEQLARLREELAFISGDYRDIIVAFYIEDRSVRDIAEGLSLSQDTVKQRLHRARKILKEGMNMAREFGRLSFRPENITFTTNGIFGENKEPWNFISRSLCKNIMLAAYRTPSTAEELSIEVGVALPYMEEELASLVDSTLMKKNDNRYETNFFIVSAHAQEKINAHRQDILPELTKALSEVLDAKLNWRNEENPRWNEGYQSVEDMKWALLMNEVDRVCWNITSSYGIDKKADERLGSWGFTRRPNGGEWDIMGLEEYQGERTARVALNGCVSNPQEKELQDIPFREYLFEGIKDQTNLTYADGKALMDIANGSSEKVDEVILHRLEEKGYIRKVANGYEPTFLVVKKENAKELPAEEAAKVEQLYEKAKEIAERHYMYCREQICKEIPTFLKDDAYQIEQACNAIFDMRGGVLEEAIHQGYLSYEEERDNRMLGVYLSL
ncbi:MAG: sigma-70 family RNA polymerase sigma factor [Lachnospiraceae bacterium]|nr:sigma-70 family RNA polymerase sigma factor [Lachnospiraceae bacterium]